MKIHTIFGVKRNIIINVRHLIKNFTTFITLFTQRTNTYINGKDREK